MSIENSNDKMIAFNWNRNQWTITGFDNGRRIEDIFLTDKQELRLMKSLYELGYETLWASDAPSVTEAIEFFDSAINFAPTSKTIRKTRRYKRTLYEIHLYRSQAHLKNRDYGKALVDINMAIKLEPKDESSYSIRAEIYWRMGNQGEACLDFIKSSELTEEKGYDDYRPKISLWRRIRRSLSKLWKRKE